MAAEALRSEVPSSKSRRFALGVDEMAALVAIALVLLIGLVAGQTVFFEPARLRPPLVGAGLAMGAGLLTRRGPLGGLREWWPLVAMVGLYVQLRPYTLLVFPAGLDAELTAIDMAIFGSVWSESWARFHHPWLTELMTLSYAGYILLPLCAALPVYLGTEAGRMRHRERFRAIVTAHVITQSVGFLGYIFVPARGPRYFLPDLAPLHGAIGYYEFASHNWNSMEAVSFDAFPSLHTATAVLAIVHAYRNRGFSRLLPLLITPPSVMLILSTVYLRMHYTIDVLAGVALGLAATWIAPRLVQRVHGEAR